MKKFKRKIGGYTEEEIREYVEKHHIKTKKDFYSDPEAENYYRAAIARGILDDLNLKANTNPYKDRLYCVYIYLFTDTNTAYVGVTCRKNQRHREHSGKVKSKQDSAVFKYATKNKLEVPDPVYLEEGLNPYEARDREDYWNRYYKDKGWNMLNKAKTGVTSGSLGNCVRISRAKIKRVASKYEYICDFEKEQTSYYSICRQRGILNDIIEECGLKYKQAKKGTLTEKYCYETAMKYRSVNELGNTEGSVLSSASRKGWLKQYWWFDNPNEKRVIAIKGTKIKLFFSTHNAAEWFGCTYCTLKYRMKHNMKLNGYNVSYFDESEIVFNIPDYEHRIHNQPNSTRCMGHI